MISGLFGGTFTPEGFATPGTPGLFSRQLIRTQAPAPQGALWIVNLASWQGRGAVPRNKTGTGDGNGTRAVVTITGGGMGGDARDVITIDYPAAGMVFAIHGCELLVDVQGALPAPLDLTPLPTLGAWVIVNKPFVLRPMDVTLTNAPIVLVTTLTFDVPPRARAYRLIQTDATGNTVTGRQFNGNTPATAIANDVLLNAGDSAFFTETARRAWVPLAPDCQAVQLDNVGGPLGVDVRIQWLLELA